MSPKTADPLVRTALIDAAARLVAAGGADSLTIRRLAAEVGASTMAIYTHFGSMEELRREMRKECFARLGDHLKQVRGTRDPVAYLSSLGWAYCFNALANPHLYRVTFLEPDNDPEVLAAGLAAYEPLVTAVQRCIDSKRFSDVDPWFVAMQLFTMTHGVVTLCLAEMIDDETAMTLMHSMAINAFVGFGDDPDAARRSIDRARQRMEGVLPFETTPIGSRLAHLSGGALPNES